jgi:oligopeptide transport system substrate-binding protein
MKSLLLVLLILMSCSKSKTKKVNDVINYPLSSEVSTLDPAISYDTISATVIYQFYETLFEYDYLKRPYTLKPLLAESMPIIENYGLRYIFKIKKGIKFHKNKSYPQGRTLKAQDFITQIKRIAFVPTKSGGWWLFEDKVQGINKFREEVGNDLSKLATTKIKGLTAPDDYTLIIDLTKKYPQLLYALSMSFTAPIPMESVLHYKNILNNSDVGTGPFYLSKWIKNSKITLKRFDGYHPSFYPPKGDRFANESNLIKDAGKKIPFLKEINFHIMKEARTRWLNYLDSKIDVLVLNKDNFKTAITPLGNLTKSLKEAGSKLQIAPTLTYWWLAFNMKDSIIGKNLNLRKAIAHAINRDEYIEIFTNNVGQKANSIYPPGVPGYDPTTQSPYTYNVEKAKAYLKLAGYPDGKGLPEIDYDVRGNSTTSRQIAEFIQLELKKIGIKINVNVNTFPGFLRKLKTGQLQFWQGGWALDYPDAENIIQLLITKNHPPGPNAYQYSNSIVDKNYPTIAGQRDGTSKFMLMKEVEEQVNKELPWVMLYYSRIYVIQQKYIKNYRHSDLIYNYFKYLRVETE